MIGSFSICSMDEVKVHPLIVPPTPGPSLSNPSVFVDGQGKILVNIRNLNYVLYHSEMGRFEHSWGPLNYLHGENDMTLTTKNILCELEENLSVLSHAQVDTDLMDTTPLWNFIGLEDARIVEWEGKTYLSGVRRDTTTNGQGRMELSEIVRKKGRAIEISRLRMAAPPPDMTYCEKNWMPVLDRPFHWIKWTNPTELVHFSASSSTTTTVKISEYKDFGTGDLRGGSQVIPFGNGYLAVVHEVKLFNSEAGRKNATYRHRFVSWDSDFELKSVSPAFSFMDGQIEFCCGMAKRGDELLITFGFQDNAAFIMSMPTHILGRFIDGF
jgi:hypothetical protein